MELLLDQRLEWPSFNGKSASGAIRCAAMHPVEPLLAVAEGPVIVEYDLLSGAQLASLELLEQPVCLVYNPKQYPPGLLAVFQDWSVRAVDASSGRFSILYAPSKKPNKVLLGANAALSPHKPWLFFSAPGSSSINMVLVEGEPSPKSAQKLKTDHKKPVTALACHPHQPLLLAGYSDGTVRVYDLTTKQLHFAFNLESSNTSGPPAMATVLLFGAGRGNHLFIGDSCGDVSLWNFVPDSQTPPTFMGFGAAHSKSSSSNPITSMIYEPNLKMVVAATHRGMLRACKMDARKGVLDKVDLALPYTQQLLTELNRGPGQSMHAAAASAHTPAVQLLLHNRSSALAVVCIGDTRGVVERTVRLRAELALSAHNIPIVHMRAAKQVGRRTCTLAHQHHLEMNHFGVDESAEYPAHLLFIDQTGVSAVNLTSNSQSSLYQFEDSSFNDDASLSVEWVRYNHNQGAALVGCKTSDGFTIFVLSMDSGTSALRRIAKHAGVDGAFLSSAGDSFLILDIDGVTVTQYNTATSTSGPMRRFNSLPSDVAQAHRLFQGPSEHWFVYASDGLGMGMASLSPNEASDARQGPRIRLPRQEEVFEVHWQSYGQRVFAAVLTSRRLMILNEQFDVVSSYTPHQEATPAIHSCLWAGPALLFTTRNAVCQLAWDGVVIRVAALDGAGEVSLLTVLNDRMVYVGPEANADSNARRSARARAIGLLQPLAMGWITYKERVDPALPLGTLLSETSCRFAGKWCNAALLEALTRCGHPSLALKLTETMPQICPEDRFASYLSCGEFVRALQMLREQSQMSGARDGGGAHRGKLHRQLCELAKQAVDAGQLETAQEAISVAGESSTYLAALLMRAGQVQHLAGLLDATSNGQHSTEGHKTSAFCRAVLQAHNMETSNSGGLTNTPLPVPPLWRVADGPTGAMLAASCRVPSLSTTELEAYFGVKLGSASEAGGSFSGGRGSSSPTSWATAAGRGASPETNSSNASFPVSNSAQNAQLEAARQFQQKPSVAFSSSEDEEEPNNVPAKPKIQLRIRDASESQTIDASALRKASASLSLKKLPQPPGSSARVKAADPFDDPFDPISSDVNEPPDQPQLDIPGNSAQAFGTDFASSDGGGDFSVSDAREPAHAFFDDPFEQPNSEIAEQGASNDVQEPQARPSLDSSTDAASAEHKPNHMDPFHQETELEPANPKDSSEFQAGQAPTFSQEEDARTEESTSQSSKRMMLYEDAVSSLNVEKYSGMSPVKLYSMAQSCLEKNKLPEAVALFGIAAKSLGASSDASASQTRLVACVQYKLASMLLSHIQRVRKEMEDGEARMVEMARLARHLASLSALEVKHRVIYMRVAVHHNLEVGNYGFAQRTLEVLLSMCPPALRANFQSQLETCSTHQGADAHLTSSDDSSMFCAKTLEAMRSSSSTCNMCTSKFATALQLCVHCGCALQDIR